MQILLTFTGFHDPYSTGLIGDEQVAGPILSLIQATRVDKVVLFSTPNTKNNTQKTQKAISEIHPAIILETIDLPLYDPTDYIAILSGLRKHIVEICDAEPDAELYVSVASGTPQMHACWLLLSASGELPAHILHIRPPKFVTKDKPLVSEIDLTSPEFPLIRTKIGYIEANDEQFPDVEKALQQLGIVGDHSLMLKAIEMAAMLAPSNVPILLLGETGTGKELFAKLIHLLSGRPLERFVAINCAAIPKDLVESFLFGHKKGAFTGATNDQDGKFSLADGGTLFLDELAELPIQTQAKLLRVLQDGLVEPIGSRKAHKVNVRLVAATNINISKAIKEGTFREDVYYRLNVGEIHLPSLRQRKSDIPKIALHILDQINASLKKPKRLSPSALLRLQGQRWQGNIRDLKNVLERSMRLIRKDVLEADDLLITEPHVINDSLSHLPEPEEGFSLETYIGSIRKQLLLRAIESANGNKSKAAKKLGISPQAVHKFMKTS